MITEPDDNDDDDDDDDDEDHKVCDRAGGVARAGDQAGVRVPAGEGGRDDQSGDQGTRV